uniref:Uncharacterized protein n=1 Tax=Arundo donax TaxID=35708 RepID=A0A0A9E3V2_ARUDO
MTVKVVIERQLLTSLMLLRRFKPGKRLLA